MFQRDLIRGWRPIFIANAIASFGLLMAGTAMAQADYALQPGDLLTITVYEEPELAREALIRPDGGISFPLIGDVSVADKSTEAVKMEIETRLAEFVPGASVTVAVQQTAGNQVFVVGKVNRPGAYPIYRPLDVMQALALAGGTAPFAALDDIRILRRTATGTQDVLEFRYTDVARGRNLEQNRLLKSGDTIVVP
jgi:polysaccharide export outer membrane protein